MSDLKKLKRMRVQMDDTQKLLSEYLQITIQSYVKKENDQSL